MVLLEENFKWHLEAFASELFIYLICIINRICNLVDSSLPLFFAFHPPYPPLTSLQPLVTLSEAQPVPWYPCTCVCEASSFIERALWPLVLSALVKSRTGGGSAVFWRD